MQNLVAITFLIWGTLALLGRGHGRCPRNILLPHCYRTKFHRSSSNSLGVGRGTKNVLGMLGPDETGAWPTPRNMLLHSCTTIPDLVTVGQTIWA